MNCPHLKTTPIITVEKPLAKVEKLSCFVVFYCQFHTTKFKINLRAVTKRAGRFNS